MFPLRRFRPKPGYQRSGRAGCVQKSRDVAALDTRQAKAWADPDLLKAEWRRRLTDEKFDIDNYIGQAQTRAEPPGPVCWWHRGYSLNRPAWWCVFRSDF